ncbi:MAG: cell division protein SepF [Microlunatus sp.]|nr:cell division protein SepF [Microlunatus sp.]MDN5770169.1 cell division protein SepF [Microlunatus sp.]
MAERLKRAAAWLGLVTDDRYGEYDEADGEQTEGISREELVGADPGATAASTSATTGWSATPQPEPRSTGGSVTPLETKRSQVAQSVAATPALAPTSQTADMSRIVTVHPRTYNEARTIGEHFRDGVPVIMNLSEMEDVDAKRLVDFAAGLIFGLRGTIERVTSKVFLLSPRNVNVTAEDKERIAGGFFNQS